MSKTLAFPESSKMAPGLFWEGTPKLCAYLLPRYNSFCAPPVQSLYRFIVFPYRLFYNRNNRAKAGYKQPVGASCGPLEILSTRKFISNPNHKSSGKAGSSRQCLMFISLSYLIIKKTKENRDFSVPVNARPREDSNLRPLA